MNGVHKGLMRGIYVVLILIVFSVLLVLFRLELLNLFNFADKNVDLEITPLSLESQSMAVLLEENSSGLNITYMEFVFEGNNKKYRYNIKEPIYVEGSSYYNLTIEEVLSQDPSFSNFSEIESVTVKFQTDSSFKFLKKYTVDYTFEKEEDTQITTSASKVELEATAEEKSIISEEVVFTNTDRKLSRKKPHPRESKPVEDVTKNETINETESVINETIIEPINETVNETIPIENITLNENGLMTYFNFNELNGNNLFDYENKYNGALVNGQLATGISGNSLNLSGEGYLDLGKHNNFSQTFEEITISVWLKPSLTSDDTFQGIVMHGGPNIDTYAVYIHPRNKEVGFKTTGVNNYDKVSAPALWDGNWHNLVAVYDGTRKTIYLDGVEIFGISANGTIESGEGYRLLVGAGRDYEVPVALYDGLIDELKIYGRGLNSSEVLESYSSINEPICISVQEVCDGIDNDCDGLIDEGDLCSPLEVCKGFEGCVISEQTVIEDPIIQEPVSDFVCPTGATCYYVSNSGSDSNSGTTENSPWKTLAKVNSRTFSPGNYILFKRGDFWEGSLTVTSSGTSSNPIVYGSYGTASEKPKIYGSTKITGWTKHTGNIYKTQLSQDINQLFLDGQRMRVSRYPDTGYYFPDTIDSSNKFTSSSLDPGINYAGAVWLGRTRYWILENIDVTSSSSKTITLSYSPSYGLDLKEGFFLMNKLEFLNQPGEWYYDKNLKTVYFWTPYGDNPSNYEIRGSVETNGVYISKKDNVVIQDLHILQQKDEGIRVSGNNDIKIQRNEISHQEKRGIRAEGTSYNLIIDNNYIHDMNGMGIWSWNAHNALISNNNISNVALWDHLGISGLDRSNSGSGMEVHGKDLIIRYNRINTIGGVGIFYRNASLVEYNFIHDTNLIKDDGGGIYTNGMGSNSIVRNNIVFNSIGTTEGYFHSRNFAECIYIDETPRNVLVEKNTMFNCNNSGIYLHVNDGAIVKENTIYNARQGILINKYFGSTKTLITNNLIVAGSDDDDYEPRQLLVKVGSYNANFDYNTYVNPFATSGVFRGPSYYDFNGWKSYVGSDSNSQFIGTPLGAGETIKVFYNDGKASKTFNLGSGTYKEAAGNTISGSFTLEPFTSKIIIGKF